MESKGMPLQYRSDKLTFELEQYSYSSPLHSTYGVPMPLNLNCKVFLSHSGCDKEFVRFLYAALCSRYQDKEVGFFDEETLPKGEAISMVNILAEATKSQLGVLVLTEDFFVQTPNPMLELEAFTLGKVKLLPLFFGMSVEEFKKKIQTRSWEDLWRKWSAKQLVGKSNVEELIETWRHSLDLVTHFSGLERKKIANSNQEYIQKVVDEVTRIIPPTILFSEKQVCGKNRLCQMVDSMYEKCAAKYTSSIDRTLTEVASTSASSSLKEEYSGYTTLDLVGIYGFSGLGKTTLCKCLCDFYFAEFNGRVYYVDVGSSHTDYASSQKHSVLTRLSTSNNNDFLHFPVIEQHKNLFAEQFSSMKDPIFLAIDNILPDKESQEEASSYLIREFPKGSKLLITSKSESILMNLASLHSRSFSVVIEHMLALTLEEAREIFVHEFPDLHTHGFSNLEDDIMECVKMCTIHKVRYHPLMLKSLAASLKWDNSDLNLDLKGRLKKLRLEGIVDKESAWEKVFTMLDKSYALLSEEKKRVFLDLALFCNATHSDFQMYRWIEMLHSHLRQEKMNKIILQLHHLCFLEKKEYWDIIPDLMVDFGKHKIEQGDFPNTEYLVRDSACGLADLPRSARTISISGYRGQHDETASGRPLDLRDVEGVKVLHIVDNPGLQEVQLSNITCARLRSLIVRVPVGTSLFFTCERDWSGILSAHETGEGLQWVDLKGDVRFRPSRLSKRKPLMSARSNAFFSSLRNLAITSARDEMDLFSVLGGLRNLEALNLSELPSVRSIDVTTCANLKRLKLVDMPGLELISGLENSSLKWVDINGCDKVSVLTIPADSETDFFISECRSLKRVSFRTKSSDNVGAGAHSSCFRIGIFDLFACPAATKLDGLSRYTGYLHKWSFAGLRGINDLQKLFAVAEFSKCKAQIAAFKFSRANPARLAGTEFISLMDAQHIGVFITALFKAQPEKLWWLSINCKEGGDCGCDQNAPLFGPLPLIEYSLPMRGSIGDPPVYNVCFYYCCSQVKALASLGQWHGLTELKLRGCTSVEIWPDFAAMTLLVDLDLSFTSLKEWPAGVRHLPYLQRLVLRGCQQLPAEELMKVVSFELQPATPGIAVCVIASLAALKDDLKRQRTDRCSVAEALDGVYLELVALFDRSSWSLPEAVVLQLVVAIMYDVLWLLNGEADVAQELHIREKMKRLLCSERFLSLPFRACDRCFLLSHSRSWSTARCLLKSTSSVRDFCMARGEEESERKDHAMREMALKGIALGGAGGSVACLNIATPVNDHLRDTITDFRRSLTQLQTQRWRCPFFEVGYPILNSSWPNSIKFERLEKEELRVLERRVREGVGSWEVGSVAAEFVGEVVAYTIRLARGVKADSPFNPQLYKAACSNYYSSSNEYSSADEADSSDYYIEKFR